MRPRDLARFLEGEAQRLDRAGSLLARARGRLRDRQVLAPGESVLRRAVGSARQAARTTMAERMVECLSPSLRKHLDGLLDTGDDDRFSALNRIKESTSSPSVTGMRRLLARLELIEATDVLAIDIGWVNGNYQRVLYHNVRVTSADRLREMVAPRRRLALVCFLHQAWSDTLDQAVDMYAKLLERSRKLVENRLDEKLKAQRHAVDRIVPRYRGMSEVLLDPDIDDTKLRARLFAVVSENELREDHVDLAHWTRGDRKARFEEMAGRHGAVSRFAAPFLARMGLPRRGRGKHITDARGAARVLRHPRGGTSDVATDDTGRLRPQGTRAARAPRRRHRPSRWESALFLKVCARDPRWQPRD